MAVKLNHNSRSTTHSRSLFFIRIDFIIHSAHKDLETFGLLNLETEKFYTTMQPESFVAPAYKTKKGNNEVFVIVSLASQVTLVIISLVLTY